MIDDIQTQTGAANNFKIYRWYESQEGFVHFQNLKFFKAGDKISDLF